MSWNWLGLIGHLAKYMKNEEVVAQHRMDMEDFRRDVEVRFVNVDDKLINMEKLLENKFEALRKTYLSKDEAEEKFVSHKTYSQFLEQSEKNTATGRWVFGIAFVVVCSLLGVIWTTIQYQSNQFDILKETVLQLNTETREELSHINGKLAPFDFVIE